MERYTKIELLGSGGMGHVWKVRDETLHCYWAMKCLKEDATNQQKQDFAREVELLTKLHHVAIPRIVERIHHGVIMDWIEGKPLSEYRESVNEEQLIDWAEQLLDILAHVHAQGILYLDLKPDNIMLDQNHRLHLIDFGIAQYACKSETRKCYGTIGYAPKEQYEQKRLDPRTDIYAFGKTLIALNNSIDDVGLFTHRSKDDTTLSKGMRNIICGCIHEQAQFRYTSVKEIQNDLHRLKHQETNKQRHPYTYKQIKRMFNGMGACFLMMSIGCFYQQNCIRTNAFEGAMAKKDYALAITIKSEQQEPYQRMYEDIQTKHFSDYKQSETLENAFLRSRKDALNRMQEVRLSEKVCDETFLVQVLQDAILCRQSKWYPFVDAIENASQKAFYRKMVILMDHFDAHMLEEITKTILAKPQQDESWLMMTIPLCMEYERHQSELSETQFQMWQTLLHANITHMENATDLILDVHQKQMLYHAQMKSKIAYARYLRSLGKHAQMEVVLKEAIEIQELRKKQGKQDEQIACAGANAHLYLFQRRPTQTHHLIQSHALFEEALRMNPHHVLAQEGKADCERLMNYWIR